MRAACIALASTLAFTTLPVKAVPGASFNLIKVDSQGIRALPDLPTFSVDPSPGRKSPSQSTPSSTDDLLLSQASIPPTGDDVTELFYGREDFEIEFKAPLPRNLSGYVSIRRRSNANDNGEEVERIPLDSSKISFSDDRTVLIIQHDAEVRPGETLCALLPDGPASLPERVTPCCFTVSRAASVPRKTAPCSAVAAAPPAFPWWTIPVGIGAGVIICAIAGCFSSGGGGGGGGGGSGPSSR